MRRPVVVFRRITTTSCRSANRLKSTRISSGATQCAAALEELAELAVGAACRGAGPGAPLTAEERAGLHASVVSRVGAEQQCRCRSVCAMFDDMHFVYAGLGAAGATVVLPHDHAEHDALRGAHQARVQPESGGRGCAHADAARARSGFDHGDRRESDDEAAFTLSAVVTREGRLVNLELHPEDGQTPAAGSSEARAVQDMLGAMSQARFEPARVGGLPIAVNMVWLVAHTTVRATKLPKVRCRRRRPPRSVASRSDVGPRRRKSVV